MNKKIYTVAQTHNGIIFDVWTFKKKPDAMEFYNGYKKLVEDKESIYWFETNLQ